MRFPSESERQKRARLIELLDTGVVLVNLDPRVEGADLPAHLRQQPVLGLNLSRRYHLDVFEVAPLAVKASLSFGGVRHLCILPWNAIFSMSAQADGTSESWPESFPPELLSQIARGAAQRVNAGRDQQAGGEQPEGGEGTPPPPRRRIRGRRGNAAAAHPDEDDAGDAEGAESTSAAPAGAKSGAEGAQSGVGARKPGALKVASIDGKTEAKSDISGKNTQVEDEAPPEPPRPPSGRPNLRIVK